MDFSNNSVSKNIMIIQTEYKGKFFKKYKVILVIGKMKDKSDVVAIEWFFWLKQRCIRFWQMIVVSMKNQRVRIKALFQEKSLVNARMLH